MNGMGWESWDIAPKWPILQCSNADVALMVWSYLNFICGIVRAHMGLVWLLEEVSFNSRIAWECWMFWISMDILDIHKFPWISNPNPSIHGY